LPDSVKANWVSQLKRELRESQERYERWISLASNCPPADLEFYRATTELRKSEVKQLTELIQRIEKEDL
jgi:hypothetical protein